MSVLFELERMERLAADIEILRFKNSMPITKYKMQEGQSPDGACCSTEDWEDYKIETPWSELDSHRWLRTSFQIPEELDGQKVLFVITTGREGQWDATNPQMLFYLNGEIIQGVDVNHREIIIANKAHAGEEYQVALKAYSGSVKGDLLFKTEIKAADEAVEELYYDFLLPVQAARVLKKDDAENCRRILQKIAPAADKIDLRKPYSQAFYESIKIAENILKKEFYEEENNSAPLVSAIGHTHIDIAWLWTVAQTREKVLRSFATVLKLMEEYPDYKFMSSQPILYQFVKEQEPEMYEKIKQRVAEGRWEVDGAMWLESDCNLPSGESLVRQILKGHKFILEEFGKESKSLWLPDVFGYSAAIPQILSKSRINYFMTTKIAWNQYNQLPNDTFMWRGIDGSETFVFMPTTCDYDKHLGLNVSFTDTRNTTTYTGIVNPNMTLGTFKRFQNKDLTEDTLMLFGFGDGGGGPTKEMLESAKRLQYGLPGIPRLKQEFETEFFDRTYKQIAKNPQMPTWDGELYFEYHRGTYTSMGKNKRNNRKSEILYEQLETWGSIASLLGGKYPEEILKTGWDIILLNQFHDIIPGSSIEAVYEQTDKEYAKIISQGTEQVNAILSNLASRLKIKGKSAVVFQPLGYKRDDIVKLSADMAQGVNHLEDENGNSYPVQYAEDGSLMFYAKDVPSVGCKAFSLAYGDKPIDAADVWTGEFENDFYSAKFNNKMQMTSLVEKKSGQELIKETRLGNELLAYEDRPMNWDNWDLDIYYKKKPYNADSVSKPQLIEAGPIRKTIRTIYKFVDSTITQDVQLYKFIPRIDFKTKVSWKEHNVLLKANFPVAINSTKASYEIQFGNVERPTTNNNSWDTAQFETCGHKWADLSENSLGISLLNDCKYGHSIKDGEMALTLIKSGIYPNENADICDHEFTYSIYPHSGRWQESQTIEMAYNLNVPMTATLSKENKNPDFGSQWSMVQVDAPNCFVETIKRAEDGNGLILRMYENTNSRTTAQITLGIQPQKVLDCNLLEETESVCELNQNKFTADFKGYEIKTFRLIY